MIQFELTVKDYQSFQNHYFTNHWTFFQKYWRWLFVIVFALYVFISSDSFIGALLDWGNWLIIAIVSLITYGLTRLVNFRLGRSVKSMVKKNPQAIGTREVHFDDEKVTIKTNDSSTEFKYIAFKKIEETSDHYFVFVSEQVAIILPKRISEKEALQTLIEKIRMLGIDKSKY